MAGLLKSASNLFASKITIDNLFKNNHRQSTSKFLYLSKQTMAKFPFYKQLDAMDCGPSSLRMIAKYYGKTSRTIGKLELPIRGSGKVKVGQSVNIKVDNYPYLEYGMLYGKIESISLVATDNNYSVEVSLPKGLVSNYGKKLEFSQEMKRSAEIITEDLRLIERFLSPIRALVTKNTGDDSKK